jgi:hypothetical protein
MRKSIHRLYIITILAAGAGIFLYALLSGYDYYSLSLLARRESPVHHLYRPSGLIGHGYGVIGSLMMALGVLSYMMRKRIRALARFGFLKHWLEFHIFLCTAGPILILFHTAFKFGGLVAVSFWSMVAVVASGVVGRFIYTQIPRSIDGNELTEKEIASIMGEIGRTIKSINGMTPLLNAKIEAISDIEQFQNSGVIGGLALLIKDIISRRKKIHEITNELQLGGISATDIKDAALPQIRKKLTLSRRIGLLNTMRQFFKYWHIFHLPFAITMFVILIIHSAIAVYIGYHWIF